MRKIVYLLFFLTCFCKLNAQKIVVDEIDPFTKERRIETGHLTLFSKLQSGLSVKMWSVGGRLYMNMAGYGFGPRVINNTHKLYLLTETDSSIIGNSKEIQMTRINGHFDFKYAIDADDVRYLMFYKIKAIRIETVNRSIDIELDKKSIDKLHNLVNLFQSSIVKDN